MSSSMYVVCIALCVLIVVWAEATKAQVVVWIAKPLASLGFIALAFSLGATADAYGKTILVALFFSLCGDIFLIGKTRAAFLGGLGSFLLGHIAFAVAFIVHGVSFLWVAAGLVALVLPGVIVARWLFPHVDGAMRAPVTAYFLVITAMVALATGVVGDGGDLLILYSAIVFFVSDIAVAREKFVHPSPFNRIWGLPIYYAAQVGFAFSVVT